jgi:hypothetical protein
VLPSNFNAESLKHIILKTKPPPGFVSLLTEKTSGASGQPFSTMFYSLPPGFLTGSDINAGREGVKFQVTDLSDAFESGLVRQWPIT